MLHISHITKNAVAFIANRNPYLQFSQGYIKAEIINDSVPICFSRDWLAGGVERLLSFQLTWFPATQIEG